MNTNLEIRPERTSDAAPIHNLTRDAFRGVPHAAGTEQHIVDALRQSGALPLSLVATVDGLIVGHVAFSPLAASWNAARWFGLGPISVLPAFQKQGIGSALINEGLHRLRGIGADGCALAGDPAYYHRFGFSNHSQLALDRVPPDASLFLSFAASEPEGTLAFHEAFFRTYPDAAT